MPKRQRQRQSTVAQPPQRASADISVVRAAQLWRELGHSRGRRTTRKRCSSVRHCSWVGRGVWDDAGAQRCLGPGMSVARSTDQSTSELALGLALVDHKRAFEPAAGDYQRRLRAATGSETKGHRLLETAVAAGLGGRAFADDHRLCPAIVRLLAVYLPDLLPASTTNWGGVSRLLFLTRGGALGLLTTHH